MANYLQVKLPLKYIKSFFNYTELFYKPEVSQFDKVYFQLFNAKPERATTTNNAQCPCFNF